MITDLRVLEAGTTSTQVNVAGLKDGAIVSADWIGANLQLGKVYMMQSGTESSEATFGTSYSATAPDIAIDVPDGTTVIPLKVDIEMEDYGSKGIFEIIAMVSKTSIATTATAFTPLNVRTRAAGGSNCIAVTNPTVTTGVTTGSYEFFRGIHHEVMDVLSADTDSSAQNARRSFIWTYAQDGFAPVVDGVGSIHVWAHSQAAKGFMSLFWLEFATSDLVA